MDEAPRVGVAGSGLSVSVVCDLGGSFRVCPEPTTEITEITGRRPNRDLLLTARSLLDVLPACVASRQLGIDAQLPALRRFSPTGASFRTPVRRHDHRAPRLPISR